MALLVDGQHHRMGGRVDVEADHVLDLRGEGGIVGALEGPYPMRLQAVRLQIRCTDERLIAAALPWRPPSSGWSRRAYATEACVIADSADHAIAFWIALG